MSQSAVKSSRREIRRVIGATGVEMLNEHLIRIGKLEARCEALEQVARLQREAREALESRVQDVDAELTLYVDIFKSMTLVRRLRWLLTGRV